MLKKLPLALALLCLPMLSNSQDLTQIGQAKLFTVTGGVAANSVFYEGTAMRDPFTYVLSGNVNFNISGLYNIPLSFTYSNQEFAYSQPFRFNRLSIHPSYKWITTHIGDVSMTFSPYTLSGHQFSGFGVDLSPDGPFKISAMYGRLIRPVEFNIEVPETEPAYKRIGYGLKADYDFNVARVGLTFFRGKDEINSLNIPIPVESEVVPKENLVVSLDASVKLSNRGTLNVEYATSAVTEDLNADNAEGSIGLLSFLFDERISTSYYDAFNADITYSVGNGTLGVGYERIDPDYNTFGAYFFNNDLENITANAAQSIFNNKVSVSVNAGLQRDNLDNTKSSELSRIVAALNLNVNASERLNVSGSYSNFQSFTNIRSQFDYINEVTQFDNLDSLNFKQLSQNANVAIGYKLSKSKERPQNLNFNVSFQDTQDLQEQTFTGIENTVNSSQFYNTAAAYTISFPEKTLNISTAFNATFNSVIDVNSVTLGPTLVVSKQLFNKSMRTSLSGSYNTSSTDGVKQNDILNFRFNAGYQLFEKHQFNLSFLSLFRNTLMANSNDFTVNFGYNYSFTTSGRKKDKNRKQIASDDGKGLTSTKFRYRQQIFDGSAESLISQIRAIENQKQYRDMPAFKKEELSTLREEIMLLKSEDVKLLKNKVIDYLDALYSFVDFKEEYNSLLFNAARTLEADAKVLDGTIEEKFVDLKFKIDNHKFKGQEPNAIFNKDDPDYTNYEKEYANYIDARRKFVGHRWMLEQLKDIKNSKVFNKNDMLSSFKSEQLGSIYKVYDGESTDEGINNFIMNQMVLHYQKLAKDKVDQEKFILRYVQKSN